MCRVTQELSVLSAVQISVINLTQLSLFTYSKRSRCASVK